MSDSPIGAGRLDAALVAATSLAERFHAEGHRLYLVGGFVRDHLLGTSVEEPDLDFTTDARPDQIKALLTGLADVVWTQGERFGTIGCRVGPRVFEITTHRVETYDEESRKPVVVFGDSIEDDLARRDFTVNAMAIDVADGRLIDPFDGQADLGSQILRTPLDPDISFSEDPLRMLRAARFIAGYGLTPVPELVASVTALVDRMTIVSVERIRDELEKLLLLREVEPGFEFLGRTGLWSRLFPTLPPDSLSPLAARVRAVDRLRAERWAAFASTGGSGQLSTLRLSNALRADVAWFLGLTARLDEGLAEATVIKDRTIRELAGSVPRGERLERGVRFARDLAAAAGTGTAPLDALLARIDELRAQEPDFDDPVLPLDGAEVMEILGLEPGPAVGQALDLLRRQWREVGSLSRREAVELLEQNRPD